MLWLTETGGLTASSPSTSTVAIAPPFACNAMASSSRHTPGSRIECVDRKPSTQSVSDSPSTMLLLSDDASFITGVALPVDGGSIAGIPSH